MLRVHGSVQKTVLIRVGHTLLFELGLVLILIPMIAWYLNITLVEALVMDVAIVLFYLGYAFFFNMTYDRVFPVPLPAAE